MHNVGLARFHFIPSLQISKADAQLSAAQQDLIIRTADAYFAVLSAVDTLEFAKAQRKAIGRQLEQAKRRYEVGIIAITDVHEAQAGYDSAHAQVIAAENSLQVAKETLRELTGQYIEQIPHWLIKFLWIQLKFSIGWIRH